ncbi:MAG: recombinase zinc beta ribbon domain-containing protein, partial [Pseudomonadota bacterium]
GQVRKTVNDEWGYRTPRMKRRGGTPIAYSSLHRIFTSPFYAGQIPWRGKIYPGKHKAMITLDEFDRVQRRLGRPTRTRAKQHSFPFRGIIKCGACGLSVTAEHKTNRHGHKYIYYHCTRRHRSPRCKEPSVEARLLQSQVHTFLQRLHVPDTLHDWALQQLAEPAVDIEAQAAEARTKLEGTISDTETQLSNLTDLRIRTMISDDEFEEKRRALTQTLLRLRQNLEKSAKPSEMFEPQRLLLTFSNRAIFWFEQGGDTVKRRIIETVSSNPTLKSKILSIQARKPFVLQSIVPALSVLRGVRDDVRTPKPPISGQCHNTTPAERKRVKHMLKSVDKTRHMPETQEVLQNIKWLIDHCEPKHSPQRHDPAK